MPRLIIMARNGSARQVSIDDPVTTIGRAMECRVRIDSEHVSRNHAIIQWERDRYVLTDMGSRNGTYVDDELVTNHSLSNGDAITVGDCRIRFLQSASLLLPGEALRLLTLHDALPHHRHSRQPQWFGRRPEHRSARH